MPPNQASLAEILLPQGYLDVAGLAGALDAIVRRQTHSPAGISTTSSGYADRSPRSPT